MTLLFVEQAAFTTAVEASKKIAAAAVARPKDGEDFIFFAVERELDKCDVWKRREHELRRGWSLR